MSPCARELVRDFLAELDALKLTDTTPPMHLVEWRLPLARMVLEELGRDDVECLAVRAQADARRACSGQRGADVVSLSSTHRFRDRGWKA